LKQFTTLIQRLEQSNKTNDKIAALIDYFREADDRDKIWVVAFFTGKKPRRPIKSALLREWTKELTGLPEWLFTESYHNVGDLSETIALLLPTAKEKSDIALHQWIADLQALENKSDEEKKTFVLDAWNKL